MHRSYVPTKGNVSAVVRRIAAAWHLGTMLDSVRAMKYASEVIYENVADIQPQAIYRGSPNSRQTPLLISIRHNADLAKRDDQRAAEFMAATTDALLVPSGLVCLTVEFSGSDTYRSADNRLEDCVVKHAADRPLGFETVLSSFSDVKRGVTGYRLSAIVSLKHDNSKSALQSQDVAIEDVPAYKSHLHGVISYSECSSL